MKLFSNNERKFIHSHKKIANLKKTSANVRIIEILYTHTHAYVYIVFGKKII